MEEQDLRNRLIQQYRRSVIQHRSAMTRLRRVREEEQKLQAEVDASWKSIEAMRTPAEPVAHILRRVDGDRYIVQVAEGKRFIVGARPGVCASASMRVSLDLMTMTIMRALPRQVDPVIHAMTVEDPGSVSWDAVGGLNDQIRDIREVIELPITNPELFTRVGIKQPKGVLLYGPPGTGKTLLARAIACNIQATFLKIVASAIMNSFIGESARIVREMFQYARDHAPAVIFIDEIDAIGAKRTSSGSHGDREVQRTLMELLNQLDGFHALTQVKVIMATNRPDTLDPALLRPGRLDRKVEIPLPTPAARKDILRIHSQSITRRGEIALDDIVMCTDGFNGADLRNVCTEAGLCAIRADRDYVTTDDFLASARKIAATKKLESSMR